ncbi:hypothetical protein Godav_002750, partial [Gossypium davidsonii]|nr:hypothetical protein [Gossypium davidsonii]
AEVTDHLDLWLEVLCDKVRLQHIKGLGPRLLPLLCKVGLVASMASIRMGHCFLFVFVALGLELKIRSKVEDFIIAWVSISVMHEESRRVFGSSVRATVSESSKRVSIMTLVSILLAHPRGPLTTNKAATLAKFLERKLQDPNYVSSINPQLLELAVNNAKATIFQ